MKTVEKNSVIVALEKIHSLAKDSRLEISAFKKEKAELKIIQNYFKVDVNEAILLSVFFIDACIDEIEIKEVIKYLGLKSHEILTYIPNLNSLKKRQLLKVASNKRFAREDYTVNKKVIENLSLNLPLSPCFFQEEIEEDTFYTFLNKVDLLSDQKDNDEITYGVFIHEFQELINSNLHFPMVDFIQKNLTGVNAFLFIDTIIDCLKSCENDFNTNLEMTIKDYFGKGPSVYQYMKRFLNEETKLNKLKLVEKDNSTFKNNHCIRLTEKAVTLLKEKEGIEFEVKTEKNKKLIYPSAIQKRKLHYNPSEIEQLNIVFNAMPTKAFNTIQERLISNNMTSGITTLLYGAPGTGKTETVYQIAKKYNRAIFKVDISETKSMWFGESQKLVKKIFSDYNQFRKKEKNCPILLFNEADAVIGKRKAAGSSNVADTENAIQNILLEELETFDGILFATTNLIDNLDAAFERRFLFKVKFAAPSIENAAKIWKTKLSFLTSNESKHLASNFAFSGGQMENIAKKCMFTEIIKGEKSTLNEIVQYCENELWGNKKIDGKMGY